jgi:nucleoside-diphosphate-sugar epimerase
MKSNSLLLFGGTGFIGQSILKYFLKNIYLKKKINKIIIISRYQPKIDKFYKKLKKSYDIIKINSDISKLKKLPYADNVIYAAILKNYKKDHIAFSNYLNLAKKYHLKSKILYLSSGAVYGVQKKTTGFKEDYLKYNKKISFNKKLKYKQYKQYKQEYSDIKLKNENLLQEFGKKYRVKVSIARCFSFSGEHLPLNSQYALGNFIKNILNNEDIRVKSNYKVIRSYMHSDDLAKWLLKIMNNSTNDCPIYNVGSNDYISIHKLAGVLAKKYNLSVDFKDKILKRNIDIYVPNIQKAKKELNLTNNFNSLDAIFATINILKKKI